MRFKSPCSVFKPPSSSECDTSIVPAEGLRSEATTLSIGGVPMRGRSPHVFAALVVATAAAAMLVLGLSSGAVAANPHPGCSNYLHQSVRVITCHFSNSFADPDFCGTGKTVGASFEGRFTVPNVPTTEPVGRWNNSNSRGVLTSPDTGESLVIQSSYRFTDTVISGDPSGAHSERWVFKGEAETIRVVHGGVIARDAGNLVVEATFDGVDPDPTNVEILSDSGGHSMFLNGDCSVTVPALGLS